VVTGGTTAEQASQGMSGINDAIQNGDTIIHLGEKRTT
jgi:hypothetical protein